mgnify:CR=1 FL=1
MGFGLRAAFGHGSSAGWGGCGSGGRRAQFALSACGSGATRRRRAPCPTTPPSACASSGRLRPCGQRRQLPLSHARGASGSSVPACPAFLAFKAQRTLFTMAVEVMPAGLSTTSQPEISRPLRARAMLGVLYLFRCCLLTMGLSSELASRIEETVTLRQSYIGEGKLQTPPGNRRRKTVV